MKQATVDQFFIPESWDEIIRIDVKGKKVLISYMKNDILHHRIYLLSEEFKNENAPWN